METINILCDAGSGKPLSHFWKAMGYANADFTYTEPFGVMYDYLASYRGQCRYMRLHNILTLHGRGDYYFMLGSDYGNPLEGLLFENGEDGVLKLGPDGEMIFDWTYVDKVYDCMINHGMRPIVETHFLPTVLKRDEEHPFIPADFNMWAKFLEAFVRHCIERYGEAEVEEWYFEVWNEPDGQRTLGADAYRGYWVEHPETLHALYDYMEKAIHGVNEKIRVGGPATMQNESSYQCFNDFLNHCHNGLNYARGTFGTRIDFISVHCKGGRPDAFCPSSDEMFSTLKRYLKMIENYPRFKDTAFINDESDIIWNGNMGTAYKSFLNFRNTHYAAGFICKMISRYISEIATVCNLDIVDSDNCHLQWERGLFTGNRSQLTPVSKYPSTDLVRKPVFNAYVMLGRLGETLLEAACEQEGFGVKYGLVPTLAKNALSVMAWNFEDGLDEDLNARRLSIDIKNLPFSGPVKLLHFRIDAEHSTAYRIWQEAGRPATAGVELAQKLREAEGLALMEITDANIENGALCLAANLPMHAISLLVAVCDEGKAPATPQPISGAFKVGDCGNPQIFLRWTANQEDSFVGYRIARKAEGGDLADICAGQDIAVYQDDAICAGQTYEYHIYAVDAFGRESGAAVIRVAAGQ